jgi:ribose 5-phosphate isomerase B
MPKPVIFIGADHAGFALKEEIKKLFGTGGFKTRPYTVVDLSPKFVAGDDYPKHGFRVARHVAKTKEARGILVCGSGVGISIAANRVKGARAFDAYDSRTTKLAREENNVNIISLSGWHQTTEKAMTLVKLFMKTKFSNAQRHHRRVKELR